MPTFETLLYSVDDGSATITLNRPDKLNAFNTTMMKELIAAFDETDGDDAVRAVIVTGAGRAFCAGADLSAGGATFDYDKRGGEDQAARQEAGVHRDGGGLVTLRIYDSLKPVISAFVSARRGINPEACSSWFLPKLVGVQTALEWCYTGRIFPAQEGLEKGLVRSVHAPDDLLPAARALAREIADNTAPVSVALTRQLIWRMAGASHPMEAHRADSRAIQSRGRSGDAKEGVTSFLEKRAPVYPDKVSSDVPDIWDHWKAPTFG